MSRKIKVLDSTLRDGGYCNNWTFGKNNIYKIIQYLSEAKVDIIECALLGKGSFLEDQSKYSSIYDISESIPKKKTGELYVVLINFGEIDIDCIPDKRNVQIDGIRVAFHKKDMINAIEFMRLLKKKGYMIFMQPMVTNLYCEDEYRELIMLANEISPYAFYIVDSFGNMKSDDVKKYCRVIENLLDKEICVGLHSHNNFQLAYSNAQTFVDEMKQRSIIIDTCIMGMGRGAGNLNTELFLGYLNEMHGKAYDITPILYAIDEVISVFYHKKYWGYSLPNYLSALHNMHPNYGTFLADKNTMTVSMMNELMSLVNVDKRNSFDKNYIEEIYFSYMAMRAKDKDSTSSLKEQFKDKNVLILAPGKSVDTEIEQIRGFVERHNVVVVSTNFAFDKIVSDYIFVSNEKRYEEMNESDRAKGIVTSNVDGNLPCIVVDYLDLLCDEQYIRDNSVMMLIKLLINSEVAKIYLAGVDGYEADVENNYMLGSNVYITSREHMNLMNKGMNNMLKKFSLCVDIEFVTQEKEIRRK